MRVWIQKMPLRTDAVGGQSDDGAGGKCWASAMPGLHENQSSSTFLKLYGQHHLHNCPYQCTTCCVLLDISDLEVTHFKSCKCLC